MEYRISNLMAFFFMNLDLLTMEFHQVPWKEKSVEFFDENISLMAIECHETVH